MSFRQRHTAKGWNDQQPIKKNLQRWLERLDNSHKNSNCTNCLAALKQLLHDLLYG